jgi:SAM-dependent methyltransferase
MTPPHPAPQHAQNGGHDGHELLDLPVIGPSMTPPAGLSAGQRAAILARFYDLDVRDVSYDAELYQQLAHQVGGAVLELAVGSGRLGIPIALAGHRVVGIDNDPAMLARAGAEWERSRGSIERDRFSIHEGDFFTFRSSERFDLAFLAVNTFLLADDDAARAAVLETMRAHLQPGGVAAIEVSTPDEAELATFDGRLQLEWLRRDPETGDEVAKLVSARYDPESSTVALYQVFEWTAHLGGTLSRVSRSDVLHLLTAERLARLAERAGFGQVRLWGDHLLTPYGPGSHRAILEARLV